MKISNCSFADWRISIDPEIQLVVLDSHTLIERGTDHFVVEPKVFAAVGLSAMIFLREDPQEIEKRRANDPSRARPRKSAAAIAEVQIEAVAQAELICRTVGVPLHVVASSNMEGVLELLRRLRDIEGS